MKICILFTVCECDPDIYLKKIIIRYSNIWPLVNT